MSPAIAARRSARSTSSSCVPAHELKANDIRFHAGTNEDLAATALVGHPERRAARRRQVRWRVRHVVRQGTGRRPLRRCLPPCQFRRHLEARRRHRADGRRPHRGILHHRAPVRISFHRRHDPDPQPRRGAGDHGLRTLWLGDVALHRRLDRAQMHARDGGVDGDRRRQARPGEDHHSRRFPDAAGRAQYPARRQRARPGSAAARLQARRDARLRAREQAQPDDLLRRAQSQGRRHHRRQELSRRAPGARRARPRRGQVQRPRPAALQGRLPVADQPARPDGVRRRGSSSSSWSRRSARSSKCRCARSSTAPPTSRSASARRTNAATGCSR